MQKKHYFKTGDTFTTNEGCTIKVIEYFNALNILIEFQDKHKHTRIVRAEHIIKGSIKNPFFKSVWGVGFIGLGKFLAKKDKKMTHEYTVWNLMLARCYDKNHMDKNPTYEGCSVAEIWHNFQNFAEWFTSQKHYSDGYELDKDILIDGNRIYSPNTCILAPKEINTLFNQREAARGAYPIGVTIDKPTGKYNAGLRKNGKTTHIGYFDTVEQASQAYQKAKKEYVKQKALEWQDRIDKRLFDALMAKAA